MASEREELKAQMALLEKQYAQAFYLHKFSKTDNEQESAKNLMVRLDREINDLRQKLKHLKKT